MNSYFFNVSQKTEFMKGKSLHTASLNESLLKCYEFFEYFSGTEIKIIVIKRYKMQVYLNTSFLPTQT